MRARECACERDGAGVTAEGALLLALFSSLAGPRERSPSHKNVAVGQPQLGAAIQVSFSESAMEKPRRRGPAFVIARSSQPGKFMSRQMSNAYTLVRYVSLPGCLLYTVLSLTLSIPVVIRSGPWYTC